MTGITCGAEANAFHHCELRRGHSGPHHQKITETCSTSWHFDVSRAVDSPDQQLRLDVGGLSRELAEARS